MDPSPRRLSRSDYTVAFVCPMGVELAAVEGMLDQIDESLPCSRDKNGYTLGRMGMHNVVVAVMPEIGNNQAAVVATQLLNDFRSIRFGLLVGIGGGIPGEDEDDIRLGDVVVSKPTATFGGVVQYDMGKVTQGGLFRRTGSLSKPPALLSANLHRLQARQARLGSYIPILLSVMLERYPKMAGQYIYQGADNDVLFESTYPHHHGGTCKDCDRTKAVNRVARSETDPQIHHGTIGSGNSVIKDGLKRDQLREELGVLCVDMEAAGLTDEFPCLVIRGICDYADSHKNKQWQPYAAATAAAYAKELLSIIPAQDVVTSTIIGWKDSDSALPENTYMAMLESQGLSTRPLEAPSSEKGVNVIFVDSYNEARSVVSQAYAQLLREWTVRTNNTWRIAHIDSAGYKIEAQDGVVEIATSYGFDDMKPGGVSPKQVALDALFDNQRFEEPYKGQIKQSVMLHTSRGLPKAIFDCYDYIIVFTRNDWDNVEKLRQAKFEGNPVKSKARNVLLGSYGNDRDWEIFDPRPATREHWDITMRNIEASFRHFLTKELQWVQSRKGANHKS